MNQPTQQEEEMLSGRRSVDLSRLAVVSEVHDVLSAGDSPMWKP